MEVFGELEIIGIHTRVDARTRRKCARVQGGLYDAVWSSDDLRSRKNIVIEYYSTVVGCTVGG